MLKKSFYKKQKKVLEATFTPLATEESTCRRRSISFPEEELRANIMQFTASSKTNSQIKSDISNTVINDDDEYSIKTSEQPPVQSKRMKSSGQLHTAMVTMAIKDGNVKQLCRLLSQKECDVNHMDGSGFQPIHYASLYGELEITRILLQHSACVNSQTSNGEHALDIAVREGNFEVAQYLVDNGAVVKSIVNGISKPKKRNRPFSTVN